MYRVYDKETDEVRHMELKDVLEITGLEEDELEGAIEVDGEFVNEKYIVTEIGGEAA